jgi:predicted short-subunit dehydrogenase-like oxidoreductase (DUF2520 family)
MGAPLTLSIVGAGRLGRTLGRLWQRIGVVTLQDVLNRSPASSSDAAAFIGGGHAIADFAHLQAADLWLIAVPDDQIAGCCDRLAQSGKLTADSIVFHCSGALTSAVLKSAQDTGAAIASIHPIRSFAEPATLAENFNGTWCGVEGDAHALAMLTPLFTAIGAQFVAIDPAHKTLYHAAAVFACNYLVTLQDIAQAAYAQAGIAPELGAKLLEPLVRETVDNVFRVGPAAALTGPIARGDTATVERQQNAITAWNPAYGRLYSEMAIHTAALAAKKV